MVMPFRDVQCRRRNEVLKDVHPMRRPRIECHSHPPSNHHFLSSTHIFPIFLWPPRFFSDTIAPPPFRFSRPLSSIDPHFLHSTIHPRGAAIPSDSHFAPSFLASSHLSLFLFSVSSYGHRLFRLFRAGFLFFGQTTRLHTFTHAVFHAGPSFFFLSVPISPDHTYLHISSILFRRRRFSPLFPSQP